MNDLCRELKALFRTEGADLVGFADLKNVPESELSYGVSVAIALPKEIVRSIESGPTLPYYEMYHDINARLDQIVAAGEAFLIERGFRAFAQTTKSVVRLDDHRTRLPHKTVATRAGLGWIGKCALLVTEEYGSALRISSLITDAPLDFNEPVTTSRCGKCRMCAEHCPSGAVAGEAWRAGIERARLIDADRCAETARALCRERFGKQATLCGKCIVVCPYTRRYLSKE